MMQSPDPREDPAAIAAAVTRAGDELRRRNRLLGLPLAVWRDGRMQLVDAATLEPIVWPASVREDEPPPLPPRS